MTLESRNEIWQVEVGGKIYEAPLAELPEWIGEGSLQPDDKVRKGNLRWIEARKVPSLVPFFNARATGAPMPLVQSTTDATAEVKVEESSEPATVSSASVAPESQTQTPVFQETTTQGRQPKSTVKVIANPGECVHHAGAPSAFICSPCGLEFCKACPRAYGGSVRICPECGSLCKPATEVAEAAKRKSIASPFSTEPFGFADFGRALSYPFKFKSSLIFGGVMFMLFSLGQSASSVGGIYLMVAAIFCMMLANMLTFGVLANTISNFTVGRLEDDFLPGFEDFSIWDDVVHPFFLSIGAYISSFGPFAVVAIVGAYMVFSAATEQMDKFNHTVSRIPGTEHYAPDRTVEQSKEVRDILEKIGERNQERIVAHQEQISKDVEAAEFGEGSVEPRTYQPQDTEAQVAEVEKMINDTRARQLESIAGSQDKGGQYQEAFSSILRLAAPLVVIGLLALLWGIIYFPAACAVAGYSKSFVATINPLVGLDTIKRLGGTYVKVVLMGLVILLASAIIGGFLQIVFSPFNLPRMGNLPAIAVGSLFTFYFWTVFVCIIGFALFKSADRLKLYR